LSSVYVESIDESLQRKSRSSRLDILWLYYFKNYINDYENQYWVIVQCYRKS
jgi:hypothetical protein